MQLPVELINSLHGIEGFDEAAFREVHSSGKQVTSIRLNPLKKCEAPPGSSNIPWTRWGYYLNERPSFTFDPLFHAGCYYVQEASSMFLEQAFQQLTDLSRPLRVLDLSAAPGGKSTHIQSLLSSDSLLVSNDVIRSRAMILEDNIIKWGAGNVIVTNNDPRDFSRLEGFFDVILIDAPCSGSGLFRREPEAMEEWSSNNVQLCSQRQQRILADAWPALKKDGLLIYSTCSYSRDEDENIADWMLNDLPVVYCSLSIPPIWGITETSKGYRFWPDKLQGEGFFLACFRKKDGSEQIAVKNRKQPEQVSKQEISVLNKWIITEHSHLVKHDDTVYAWPLGMKDDFNLLLNQLRVLYSGTIIGTMMRDKMVPSHSLAMSDLKRDDIPTVELDYRQAISYLQRKELNLEVEKGWQLVSYMGHSLGWINALPNRINNYYPKELRILKDI